MAKFGINDILNAKTKAAGAPTAAEGYTEIYLSPLFTRRARATNGFSEDKGRVFHNRRTQTQRR